MGNLFTGAALALLACLPLAPVRAQDTGSIKAGRSQATMKLDQDGELRTYELNTTADLRDGKPPGGRITFSEVGGHVRIRTGNLVFDGLYAMTISEALANSVAEISDGAYGKGVPVKIEAYKTGELWNYVWTRDLSYSLNLGLAEFDPRRAVNSLLFKASATKASVPGKPQNQIIQDTGSGGSYPVSTDRVVWAMGANETLKYLSGAEREEFLRTIYPILCDTIEQDRRLVFDPRDGLYRGEQSFLDWREQTYPAWTKDRVLAIAMSKALSVNAADYFLLRSAAEYSRLLNKSEQGARYEAWAKELKDSINRGFFDRKAGLYRTYLLSEDGGAPIPVSRYDLLGESLAILDGVAGPEQAESVIQNYPTGPFGPPVVWPEEKACPIYHNQGIWPFVTAYWIKAARQAKNESAVDAGVASLEELAALNLSNMENFDFVTGLSHTARGPAIDSRRQLWSVAGYLSMVQDVVFGLETSLDGVRFQPFITARLRNEIFGQTGVIELRNLAYRGTLNRVRVHLPAAFSQGICALDRVELNGKAAGKEFVKREALQSANEWDLFLKAPAPGKPAAPVRLVDVSNERAICGPAQPLWAEHALTIEGGHVALNFRDDDAADAAFNIYRDGQPCAQGVRENKWVDPLSGGYADRVFAYAVQAVDRASGNVSHLTPVREYRTENQEVSLPAKVMKNRGGNLVGDHHFENWGKPGDDLQVDHFQVHRGGGYSVRVEFSNGAGPVNTGITCGVKKLEICKAASGEAVAAGYVVMPQSGDWNRWDLSSAVPAALQAGEPYKLRIFEDECCRNMSYLQKNDRYTAGPGGGDESCNFVNVAKVHLLYVGPQNQ